MKVAYLLGSLGRGGTETLILDMFRNLNSEHFQAIGIYRKNGTFENEFLKCKIQMIYLSNSNIKYLLYLKQLRNTITQNNIDIIHAQQPIDAFNARLACLGKKVPVLLTLHGYDYKQGFVWMSILRLIIHFTTKNIFVSSTQRDYYLNKFHLNKNNQVVVYNGIASNKFTHKNEIDLININSLRIELNLDSTTLLLGTVGNFIVGRDQLTLCKFINKLKEKTENFHFVFIGGWLESDSSYYDECVNYCTSNNLLPYVSFLGVRSDVPKILPQLDSFLYATDHDTFGIGVVEAMLAKIPVFVNDWGVMNEITEYGKYATLYKTKNEIDLLENFILFLQDKSEFVNKSELASAFVLQKFNIANHILNLKNIYLQITN